MSKSNFTLLNATPTINRGYIDWNRRQFKSRSTNVVLCLNFLDYILCVFDYVIDVWRHLMSSYDAIHNDEIDVSSNQGQLTLYFAWTSLIIINVVWNLYDSNFTLLNATPTINRGYIDWNRRQLKSRSTNVVLCLNFLDYNQCRIRFVRHKFYVIAL